MPTRTIKGSETKRRPRTRRSGSKSMRTARTGSVRLEMRLDRRVKTLIERAALLTGQTVTDFAVSNLLDSALATIERHQRLVLSDRDRDLFLNALDRPPKPMPDLLKAGRLHVQATRG
jgi:uncharacterized protein (DUF1778 family)